MSHRGPPGLRAVLEALPRPLKLLEPKKEHAEHELPIGILCRHPAKAPLKALQQHPIHPLGKVVLLELGAELGQDGERVADVAELGELGLELHDACGRQPREHEVWGGQAWQVGVQEGLQLGEGGGRLLLGDEQVDLEEPVCGQLAEAAGTGPVPVQFLGDSFDRVEGLDRLLKLILKSQLEQPLAHQHPLGQQVGLDRASALQAGGLVPGPVLALVLAPAVAG